MFLTTLLGVSFSKDMLIVPSGKISVVSPIARAVMGKNEGDEVVVKVPAGDVQYEIGSVLYL